MNIVLEGPDNSGKSTLAEYLGERLHMPVKHSGGPGKYPGEINARADLLLSNPIPTIYDRHPCVSQNIYVEALSSSGERVTDDRVQRLYDSGAVIVFCRGRDFTHHRMSEHASVDYVAQVERNHPRICELYDAWALDHAHVTFRIGDGLERIARLVSTFDPVRDIELFHQRFRLGYEGKPRLLDDELRKFRSLFMHEELTEYDYYSDGVHEVQYRLEGCLDALVDLVYVALGTSYLHGFNFREAWRRVQDANMVKVRAERRDDSKRGSTFDVVKPPGWVAPDHSDLVREHAHLND